MKRLIGTLLLILSLPVLASVNSNQSVALAGRTVIGGAYCTCGHPDCILDYCECGGPGCDYGRKAAPQITANNGNDLSGMLVILLVMVALGYRIAK